MCENYKQIQRKEKKNTYVFSLLTFFSQGLSEGLYFVDTSKVESEVCFY